MTQTKEEIHITALTHEDLLSLHDKVKKMAALICELGKDHEEQVLIYQYFKQTFEQWMEHRGIEAELQITKKPKKDTRGN